MYLEIPVHVNFIMAMSWKIELNLAHIRKSDPHVLYAKNLCYTYNICHHMALC